MKILGLDISSSKIGIALLDEENIIISDVLKFKSNQSLEERAAQFERRMREIDTHHVVFDVYVEQAAIMFRGGQNDSLYHGNTSKV
jgi:RNase H-fold protein (predicted Holliday junction resolvase)